MKDACTIADAITTKLVTASLEHPRVNLISLQTLCWCHFCCFWKAGYYPCFRLSSWVENFCVPYKQQYYNQTCNCPSSITREWQMPMPAASWDPTICNASIFSPIAAVLDEEHMLSSTHAPTCRGVFLPPSKCNGAVLESHIPENERPSSVIVPVLSKHMTLQPPITATRLTWNVLIPDTFKRRTEIGIIWNRVLGDFDEHDDFRVSALYNSKSGSPDTLRPMRIAVGSIGGMTMATASSAMMMLYMLNELSGSRIYERCHVSGFTCYTCSPNLNQSLSDRKVPQRVQEH